MAEVSQRVSSPSFIGRTHERAALRQAFERTCEGQPVAVLVAGEAGVGKTRLMNEFADSVKSEGSRVLLGGCIELSQGSLPFAPIVEALRGLVEDTEPDTLDELLGPARPELGRLLPELVSDSTRRDAGEGPDFAQGRLFEQFLGLLQRLAEESPTILIIEDLHWADDSTLDLIRFLLRNLREPNVMLLITYRSDEIHRRHPLRPFLTALDRIDSVERLELARFDRTEVSEQLRSILGKNPDPEVVNRAFERSEGNPFYVEELLATGGGSADSVLPNSLRDAVMVRVEALTDDSQEVLRVAATAGCRVDHSLLAKVSVFQERRLHDALRETVARHLLVSDERTGFYEFRHALVREAIYADLLPGEKTTLHAAFAKILEATPELVESATGAAELAYHYHQAHMTDAALPASIRAGEAAEATFAFPEALQQYERALELWSQVDNPEERTQTSRVELIRRAAEAAYLSARAPRALAHIKAAIALVDPDIEPVTAGLMHERLGRYQFAAGNTDAGLAAYSEAVRLVPDEPPSAERARVLAAKGQMVMLLSHGQESRALCEEAVRIATEVDAKAELGHALNSLGVDLAMMGDFDAGLQHLYRAKEIAIELNSIDDLGRAYANIPSVLVWAGRYEDALDYWDEGIETITRLGAGGSYGSWYRADKSDVLFRIGRWDEVEAVTREPGSESGTGRAMRLCTRAQVATARGRLDDARADLDDARNYSLGMREPQYVGPNARARVQLALAEGDSLKARTLVRETLNALHDSEELADRALLCFLGLTAEANLTTQDNASGELAKSLLEEVRQLRSASDDHPQENPIVGASAASAEAERSRLLEQADSAAWEAAAALWAKAGHPFPEAYCLFRQSEASLSGGAGHARDALLRARDIATRLGAAPLLADIESLARRARISLGAPLRRRGPSTSLTPRELDVLRLVAAGKTNSEIGHELFISAKTASVHVSHILQKLGVSSRVQAAGAARDMDLVAGS